MFVFLTRHFYAALPLNKNFLLLKILQHESLTPREQTSLQSCSEIFLRQIKNKSSLRSADSKNYFLSFFLFILLEIKNIRKDEQIWKKERKELGQVRGTADTFFLVVAR